MKKYIKHIDALIALDRLFAIAQAWNKADNFIPDFSDANQYKYFPWFKYDKNIARIVYVRTDSTCNWPAYLGSRICFKTFERAEQFGKQFEDLYNKVFLLKLNQ